MNHSVKRRRQALHQTHHHYYLNVSVEAANLSNWRIESNQKNRFGSENRIESKLFLPELECSSLQFVLPVILSHSSIFFGRVDLRPWFIVWGSYDIDVIPVEPNSAVKYVVVQWDCGHADERHYTAASGDEQSRPTQRRRQLRLLLSDPCQKIHVTRFRVRQPQVLKFPISQNFKTTPTLKPQTQSICDFVSIAQWSRVAMRWVLHNHELGTCESAVCVRIESGVTIRIRIGRI